MILVMGLYDEPVIEHVLAYLIVYKIPYVFLDERDCLKKYHINYEISSEGFFGEIDFGTWKVNLDDITGVYQRLGMKDEYTSIEESRQLESLHDFLNFFPKKVVNRPINAHSNGSKPFQYLSIISSGLKVPKTIIAKDKKSIIEFFRFENSIIVKSISSIRSIVKNISKDDIPNNYVHWHQYQNQLKGYNIRVHIIGNKIIPIKLETDYLDYRYAMSNKKSLKFISIELPKIINENCLKLMQILKLEFAGIDLFYETEKQEYYCFEVNTAPGYIWYESHSKIPITKYLLEYLS